MPEPLPRVSFIIPTLNAGALLDNCLSSIARQTYPRDRYEIILADAMSKDATRAIAARHGAKIVDDPGRDMEQGKRLALTHATGDYIVFIDADNELTHPDYIELAVRALAANPQALGVESNYLPSAKMSSFCAYVTALLHISDPICWLMSEKPRLVARVEQAPSPVQVLRAPPPAVRQAGAPVGLTIGEGAGSTTGSSATWPGAVQEAEIERWTLPDDSCAYPLGANGFVFRRADLEAVRARQHFQDTHVALHLMHLGKREWLRVRGRGVHHYYVQTLGGFVQKRRRAMVHFLNVRGETETSWMKGKPPVPGWLACLYCVTFLGPIYHTLRGLIRDRDVRWLWHVPACVGSFIGTLWGWFTHRARGAGKGIADLQVEQTLRKDRSAAR